MNRRSLRDLLDVEGVDRRSYRLDGSSLDEALSLARVSGGWRVWFTERGQAVDAHEFETEDEACLYLAERLLSDDSNRWLLVAGPADTDTADQRLQAWLESVGISRQDLTRSELRTDDLPWTATETRRRHWILRTASRRLPVTILSADLVKQLERIPEFRMGVHRVKAQLADGRTIHDVLVSGNRVSYVFGEDTIPFRAEEVAALLDQFDA
jgi:hypothetical protein